jgi:dGTPase
LPYVGATIVLSNHASGAAGRGLAPYACAPEHSRGRRHPEPDSRLRTPFQRDRDRIVHSTAFRRLEYKTQVFIATDGDHYRTRLTHSLEVAQIARTLARALGLEEDLAETIALAHDLGHSPFGHAGEDALDTALAGFGGFDHNHQTLRVITSLERRYADFDGLNPTVETLEGIIKHNGPTAGLPPDLAVLGAELAIDLGSQPGAEAQIAALADDIAYTSHDLDDGLRAGLFEVVDLIELPLAGPIFAGLLARYPRIERARLVHEGIRRVIDAMVVDLVEATGRRLAAAAPDSADAVRALDEPVATFSPAIAEPLQALRHFLHRRMYSHYKVRRRARKAQQVVTDLVDLLLARPDCLPDDWRARAGGPGEPATAAAIRDYIAGMTDRYALEEHDRLFNLTMRDR